MVAALAGENVPHGPRKVACSAEGRDVGRIDFVHRNRRPWAFLVERHDDCARVRNGVCCKAYTDTGVVPPSSGFTEYM